MAANKSSKENKAGRTTNDSGTSRTARIFVLTLLLGAMMLTLAVPVPVLAVPILPPLGTAGSFAVLAGSAVTNTGPTIVRGNLGVSPGTAISGFPPGIVNGRIHAGDAVAAQAQNDATIAYNNAAGQPCDVNLTGQDLGGMTLIPGVYCFDSSAQLTGQLTLNGQGNPDSVFIFQVGSTLTTSSNAVVSVINGAQPCRIFWQIGSSATLGTNTRFQGNILALTSITLNTGATTSSGLYALNGTVTLDSNDIQACGVGGGPTSTPTAVSTAVVTVTSSATAAAGTATTAPSTATNTAIAATNTAVAATNTAIAATNTAIAGGTRTAEPLPTNTAIAATNTAIAATNTAIALATRTAVPLPSNTAIAATNTAIAATNTAIAATNTAIAATNTAIALATRTAVPLPSNTAIAATNTAIALATNTAVSATNTAIAATNTAIALATRTAVPLPSNTAIAATNTAIAATNTAVAATNTAIARATRTVAGPGQPTGMPPTGGGLSWFSLFMLLFSAFLLALGLWMRTLWRIGGKR